MSVPTNITCATAIVIPSLPYSGVFDTTTLGPDLAVDTSECGGGIAWNALWFQWTCPVGQTRLGISVFDPINEYSFVSMYTGPCGALVPVPYPNCAYANLDPTNVDVVPGTPYYFVCSEFADLGGDPDQQFGLARAIPEGQFCDTISCGVCGPVAPTIPANPVSPTAWGASVIGNPGVPVD